MKILKTIVGSAETGALYLIDTIEHEGKLWLVPQWLDEPIRKVSKPARLIRLDILPFQSMKGSKYPADYVLNGPMPTALLELKTPKEPISGFEVRELPELEFPMDRSKH